MLIRCLCLWLGLAAVPHGLMAEPGDVYREKGDLKAIVKHGKLRILLPVPSTYENSLPRSGFPIHYETVILQKFAASLNVQPVVHYVDKREQLIPALLAGETDIIGANLTITKKRHKQIAFTVPFETVTEQIICRKSDSIKTLNDLKGREIAIHKSSSFWETVQALRKKQPGIKIKAVEETIPTEAIVDAVAEGKYDLTVADSNLIKAVLINNPELAAGMDLTASRPIAWGLRPQAAALQKKLNKFIEKEQWFRKRHKVYMADWAEIKKRKVLRVLTRNSAASYFLWRGELLGFEYELMKRFAKKNNIHVEMIVPPTRADLLTWLKQGKGDVVAASLTISAQRQAQGVNFSRRYNKVKEVVVARKSDDKIKNINDLAGRSVYVRPSSSYWQTLTQLKKDGIDVVIKPAPEDLETEEIIEKVASGEYDLTVADSHIVAIELTIRDDIKSALEVKDNVLQGWVVRKDSSKLLAKLNAFVKKEYRGLHYNILYKKYFTNKHSINKYVNARVDMGDGKISPWESITRSYASKYQFDWRLITAQMYQESGFDPKAKSWVGALGLMQVMPKTGRSMGFKDLQQPEKGLHAGVKYLAWLRERFEAELSVKDRMWFILAAYNAGLGHVFDARTLARRKGLDPNIWFGNVEQAMLLLSKKKYARRARHGYVRGYEPVQYVRKIRDRYNAYLRLVDNQVLIPKNNGMTAACRTQSVISDVAAVGYDFKVVYISRQVQTAH